MDLPTRLLAHSSEVDQTIRSFLDAELEDAGEIDRYLARSVRLLTDFSLRGGKSIRSFLGRIGFELVAKEQHPGLLKALASIELHHKHILILDDISDRDEKRYGGPTLEYAYRAEMTHVPDSEHRARSFAMLDGVYLGSISKELLFSSGFDPDLLRQVLHLFDTIMFRDTLAGWQIHGMQCTERLSMSTEEEFVKGLRLVTASYTFEGPLLVGLTLAKNTDKALEQSIREYAIAVGTAFQIHDDILGLFGDPKKTGKPVGNDVREGKKTLLLQGAYRRGSSAEKKVLEAACGQEISSDMLQEVQRIVRETGSLEYSRQMEKDFVEKGIRALEEVPECEQKQLLIDLAHYIILREK